MPDLPQDSANEADTQSVPTRLTISGLLLWGNKITGTCILLLPFLRCRKWDNLRRA